MAKKGRLYSLTAMLALGLIAACSPESDESSVAAPSIAVAGAQCGAYGGDISATANAIEPNSQREFYLEYPCDLGADEEITLVLNLHGGGSAGAWQRLYFPITDYADQYRLVVATPTAVTTEPFRLWTADADDQYLQDISNLLIESFKPSNIRSFWLAGHSQGGMTSTRIACTAFFGPRVDGFLSLAGGRVGMRIGGNPECDYSHIFATGALDSAGVAGLPDTSPLAERYNCQAKSLATTIVDTEAGKIYDTRSEATGRPPREGWGGQPAPGTAQIYTYAECASQQVVADIIRLDKGHTEGLEPLITEEIVRLMASIPGGKIRSL